MCLSLVLVLQRYEKILDLASFSQEKKETKRSSCALKSNTKTSFVLLMRVLTCFGR